MMFSTCLVLFQKVSVTFDFLMTNNIQIIDRKMQGNAYGKYSCYDNITENHINLA